MVPCYFLFKKCVFAYMCICMYMCKHCSMIYCCMIHIHMDVSCVHVEAEVSVGYLPLYFPLVFETDSL